jgi:hypothetical protein
MDFCKILYLAFLLKSAKVQVWLKSNKNSRIREDLGAFVISHQDGPHNRVVFSMRYALRPKTRFYNLLSLVRYEQRLKKQVSVEYPTREIVNVGCLKLRGYRLQYSLPKIYRWWPSLNILLRYGRNLTVRLKNINVFLKTLYGFNI